MKRRAFFKTLVAIPAGITAAAKAGIVVKAVSSPVDPFQAVLGHNYQAAKIAAIIRMKQEVEMNLLYGPDSKND